MKFIPVENEFPNTDFYTTYHIKYLINNVHGSRGPFRTKEEAINFTETQLQNVADKILGIFETVHSHPKTRLILRHEKEA